MTFSGGFGGANDFGMGAGGGTGTGISSVSALRKGSSALRNSL